MMARLSDTLYAKYILERHGHKIIENDFGFIVYGILKTELFIVDMEIAEDERRRGHATSLIDQLIDLEKECTVVTANIWLKKKGSGVILMAALRRGFDVVSANNDILLVAKDLLKE